MNPEEIKKGGNYWLPVVAGELTEDGAWVRYPDEDWHNEYDSCHANADYLLPALTLREIQLIVGALEGYAVDSPANRELLEKLEAYRKAIQWLNAKYRKEQK